MKSALKAVAAAPTISLKIARGFLAILGDGPFTFQTYDDDPDRQDRRLARILHGSLSEHADTLKELNLRGACISVTLNETDGKGCARENITKVRAVVCDLDGAPLEPVYDCPLKPHLVVETSPSRYHVYWFVTDLSTDEFEDIQRAVAKRFDGDPAIAKLTHRARLPGFLHNKAEPFQSRIEFEGAQAAYSTEQIRREFPPEAKAHKAGGSRLILPVGVPLHAARAFVEHKFLHDGLQTLQFYRGGFYRWTGTHYLQVEPDHIRSLQYDFLEQALVEKKDGIVPFNPTKGKVSEIIDALQSLIYLDNKNEAPLWLPPHTDRDAGNLIAFTNGLLDLSTRELLPHSPLLFNMNALAFDYDPDAPKPERWQQFLNELWAEDPVARSTLRELFGYFLTADTSQQKIAMIVGPKRSGKGTIAHVLTSLLGRENVVSPTMATLSSHFGMQPLIDKTLAIVPDARLSGRKGNPAVEHLLSVSGEDRLTIDRKNLTAWTGKLGARFLILTNELPQFKDASGALASRFLILTLKESFYGEEDLDLKSKLEDELPGILNWALRGLVQLRKRGYLKMPKSSYAAIQQMEDLSNPVGAFVRDRCVVGINLEVEKAGLFVEFQTWCEQRGEKPGTRDVFGRDLIAAFPSIQASHSGDRNYYKGIELNGD